MTHSSLSAIVPVRNENPAMLDNLAVLAQHKGMTEIIVVDVSDRYDTINKLDELQQCFEVLRVIKGETQGRAHQMNQGVAQAKGSIVWFIHADTQVPDGAPTQILDTVSPTQPWGRFDVQFSNSSNLMKLVAFAMNLRSAVSGICTGDQAIFISRDLFRNLGGFPEIPIMEDVALTQRLKRHSRALRIRQPVTTSARRWETHGYIKTILQMWLIRFLYWVGVSPHALSRMYQ